MLSAKESTTTAATRRYPRRCLAGQGDLELASASSSASSSAIIRSVSRAAVPVASRVYVSLLAGVLLLLLHTPGVSARSISLTKRAAFYIANGTVCNVDGVIYQNNEKIPTDNPCEVCYCRPPGFACVLKDCELKPHCKAVRREGQCCPDYHCDGCEHDGLFFSDGQVIPNTGSPCYTCYCQGSSISCSLVSCTFRNDCAARYNPGECCPRYDHCPPKNDIDVTPPRWQVTNPVSSPAPPVTTVTRTNVDVAVDSSDATTPGAPTDSVPDNAFNTLARTSDDRSSVRVDSRENEAHDSNSEGLPPWKTTALTSTAAVPETTPVPTSNTPPKTTTATATTTTTPSPPPPPPTTTATTTTTTTRPTTTTTTTVAATTTTTAATTLARITTSPPPTTTTTISTTTLPPITTEESTTTPTSTTKLLTTTTTTTTPPPSTTTATTTTPAAADTTATTSTEETTPTTEPTAPAAVTETERVRASSLSDAASSRTVHVSEEDVHRIDDVTSKLTAVTKSIYNKASSATPGTIEDWELEEFRRAVELLETHYRNFYDRVQSSSFSDPASGTDSVTTHPNDPNHDDRGSQPKPANLRRRDDAPILNQDIIDAFLAERGLADHSPKSGPSSTPVPPEAATPSPQKTADGLEDLIIPQHIPLLYPNSEVQANGAGSIAGDPRNSPTSNNSTAEDALQLLRAALNEDDDRRRQVHINESPQQQADNQENAKTVSSDANTTPTLEPAETATVADESSATQAAGTEPSADASESTSTNNSIGTTTDVLDGDEMFRELMQPSIVAAVGGAATPEPPTEPPTVQPITEASTFPSLPDQFALRSVDKEHQAGENRRLGSAAGGSASPSASARCSLTGQLASLLDTLSRTSRSQDPVLDFLQRAIHSHAIMHPDDVRTFMAPKSQADEPQPVHEPSRAEARPAPVAAATVNASSDEGKSRTK